MFQAKEETPKEFRIGNTCFMSLATIGESLFTRHIFSHYLQKDSNNLMSVIITLLTDVNRNKQKIQIINDYELQRVNISCY